MTTSPNTPSAATSSSLAHQWAESLTKSWSDEVKDEWRREQRRQNSKRFRTRKQHELIQLRREQDHLELQVKRFVAALSQSSTQKPTNSSELYSALCRLAIEGETLMREKLLLKQELYRHEYFLGIASKTPESVVVVPKEKKIPQSVLDASKKSRWVAYARCEQYGWCVNFPNEEPSFFFYPFTREEFDGVIKTTLAGLGTDPLVVGKIFGWNVHPAPLTRNAETGSLVAHVRLTTRVKCSLKDADAMVSSSDVNSWPLLTTPTAWRRGGETSVSTQVLQQFDLNSHVLVTNICGQVHFRYVHLDLRWPRENENGIREVLYVAVVGDTEANAQARESRTDVQWARDSGYCIRFTEVNETTIDVTYDRWSQSESENQAQELFVDWAQVVCRWSQRATSFKLIESG
ncbi:hypothetical protein PPTG_11676 [Phytophthora nicotianae INRA-310]|uniref:BZIP domain-containing protein n=3 Tax=Phytophthora nicotianae TaxID=4792 RepID=W2Q8J4_PHYN3|nr:hypothetical protein PPTG_11676 [Phytophthora nicotianae INRA-310]ETN08864.1 hypothetical protein PPTG_11676 [Phytophthora nicotianae INRA-310]